MMNKKAAKYFFLAVGENLWLIIRFCVSVAASVFGILLAIKFLKWFLIPIGIIILIGCDAYGTAKQKCEEDKAIEEYRKVMDLYGKVMDAWNVILIKDSILENTVSEYRKLISEYEIAKMNLVSNYSKFYFHKELPDAPWNEDILTEKTLLF